MPIGDAAETGSPGRIRRVAAIVLSLVGPVGGGHFLLGAFRRGIAWALGLATLAIGLLFVTPVSVLPVALPSALVVGVVGRITLAFDAARIVVPLPSWKMVIVSWAALIAAELAVVEPLKRYYRAHYAQAFTIPSAAMKPALLVGDYIMVDKSAYRRRAPQRGEIVVFAHPRDEQREFVKRIVGLPGDIIQVRGRRVLVNGQPLAEPYLEATSAPPREAGQSSYCPYAYACDPTPVPVDSYFMMGDNRDNSEDSRYWGFVRRERIRGRISTVYWSWDGERHWPRLDRIGRSL